MLPTAAPFTRAGILAGIRLGLPVWPSIAVFGAAFGAAAAQRGLTLSEALGMSAFVYAGAAQMVTLEVWGRPWTLSALLAAMTVTALINARMILMGATVQPWLRGTPFWRTALTLFFLVDAGWLIGMRHRAEGGRDLGILFGAGFGMWPLWIATTGLGHLAGGLVAQPRAYALDMIMPIFFAAMLAPLWRGVRPALPWLVSGAVALAVQRLVPGYGFIAAGALAGLVTGALVDDGAAR
ncbi:AzlC family protein [Methylobacterium sp. 4-46]|uniref:AzlC family ABC transporter permease n=1 Tax=unclassified Methylobacterium TaxID=2615210 RepID=UPI000165C8F3|nr:MULTISPECIES: AzlC family ABC transporter permease [Methylobacterium]ACA16617.1 AzlC family protein [Methylobacterium sp. 4-46]WFT82321.1 AzlC family ABC transporter permease [Methylobacterium nodulans]